MAIGGFVGRGELLLKDTQPRRTRALYWRRAMKYDDGQTVKLGDNALLS